MTDQNNKLFRKQLLAQEKTNPELQKTFQLEAKKMYTEKLKKSQRFAYVVVSIFIAIMTLFFWVLSKFFEEMHFLYDDRQIEPLRLASKWAMFLSIVLFGLSLWPAICGKIGLRFYPKAVRFIFWILILSVAVLLLATFGYLGGQTDSGVEPEFIGVLSLVAIILVMGVYMLLSGRIDRGDLKNKIKTLELEYRLCEMEEKLNRVDGQISTEDK